MSDPGDDGRATQAQAPDSPRPAEQNATRDDLRQAVAAMLVGLASAAVAAAFRAMLELATAGREQVLAFARDRGVAGFALVVLSAVATGAFSVWLVRRFAPEAAGSGIPHVEEALAGRRRFAAWRVLVVKFASGLASMGGGMALGREGPTVQMGAAAGQIVSRLARLTRGEGKLELAFGAGAGLAAAFNAPISGAIFIIEEMRQRATPLVVLAYLVSTTAADVVARITFGQRPVFSLAVAPIAALAALPLAAIVGLAVGTLGVAFNRCLLATLAMFDRMRAWPKGITGAVAGACVTVVAWWLPDWIGDGHRLAESLFTGSAVMRTVALMLAVRFALTMVCYGCGAAGGIFTPLLCLGVIGGRLVAEASGDWITTEDVTTLCMLSGMAAMFGATVRAPITGIMLVLEMTGELGLLLPLLTATCAAVAVAEACGEPPIYESLKERDRRNSG